MAHLPGREGLSTHHVENQPALRDGWDLWKQDATLKGYAKAFKAQSKALAKAGRLYGSADIRSAAAEARRDPPWLVGFDPGGRRLDEVRFNAGYHQVMSHAMQLGYHNIAWAGQSGGHVTHAAHVYMLSQVAPAICCPLTMTYAAVPALAQNDALAQTWRQKLQSPHYDPTIAPIQHKKGATLGMAMTEKQGGSDLRKTTTRAEPLGDHYRLYGHKWFCSAPMSDGFLTLAQAPGGLSCFLVPRWLPEGRNAIHLMRLKNKLGNHANASAEIEYHGAVAYRMGPEGAGIRQIIEMVHHTRLDTALAPAGLMRAALTEACDWVAHRRAFQRRLIDQPLMRAVLADLALDAEGALALGLLVAASFDGDSDCDRAFARIAVALAKFLNNKRCPHVIAESMEVLGGMGYVEDTALPMLYREAPLNGIWEGSGNVICLDILRTLTRDSRAENALNAALDAVRQDNMHYAAALDIHRKRWPALPPENEARWFAESLATLLTAATLISHAPNAIAEAYIASRLSEHRGTIAGSLDLLHTDHILKRLLPPQISSL